ncbi:MAG: RDD family protein [Propionibacteriaceae bacterium]|jgi:hypothetical protein|nr:RDD family protein [Propionibacteriaceae bacterium]
MADDTTDGTPDEPYPGQRIGLPETGRGSLASWFARVAALILDWAACMILAVAVFGPGVLRDPGWKAWMVLAIFFVESTVLTALIGSSFGQYVARIGIFSLDGRPLGWGRAVLRAGMVCLVLPTIVIGADRRALNDLLLGTFVGNLR